MKTNEEMFQDFLEMLEKDSKDQYVGHLFEFIQMVLGETMNLGKDGFSPMMGITLYAKHVDGNTQIVFHPYMSGSMEVYQILKLGIFSDKLKTSIAQYCMEVWGMTPIDERNDLKSQVIAIENFNINWGHLKKND